MTPNYTGMWGLLYDWQTIITGGLAILAAAIGAWAAYRVGNIQVAAAKQRDRLQARCIAVGIYPELLAIGVTYDRALKIINEELPKAKAAGSGIITAHIVALIRHAHIEVPPILARSIDQFYLLDDAGPTLLQFVSITSQYNDLIDTLTQQIAENVDSFDPPGHAKALSGQLKAIRQLLDEANKQLISIHDEATSTPGASAPRSWLAFYKRRSNNKRSPSLEFHE